MRLARFSLNDSPRYAFVQKDETDGKDYLIELDGHPLAGDQVKPTGTRYPVDGRWHPSALPGHPLQGLRSGQEL